MANNQPTPRTKAKNDTLAERRSSRSTIHSDAPKMAQLTAIKGKKHAERRIQRRKEAVEGHLDDLHHGGDRRRCSSRKPRNDKSY